MLRVRNTGIYGANLNALLFFEPADTLGAFIRVNNVDFLPLFYGFIFAFWFAGTTADAVLSNFICHLSVTSLNF